jgi:L-proline amide hydrolase
MLPASDWGRMTVSITEATAPASSTGNLAFRDWTTWYRITGELTDATTPLVVLHGGPGATHHYTLRIADLAALGRPVVHYDQLGNGASTHLPDKGADFWTVDLFLDELDAVLAGLGIAESYHLLGQSWGGMLAAEHAVRRPAGLRSLVVANSPASIPIWVAEANRLRSELPPDVQQTLLAHEANGTTDHPDYRAAGLVFNNRHVCRIVPNPPEVEATFHALEAESTVYNVMNGPNEFYVIGTLKDWTIIDRLDQITAPTLLISGRYDEATPATVQPYADQIPNVRWEIFENSSHMPHVEENEAYVRLVGAFLAEHD